MESHGQAAVGVRRLVRTLDVSVGEPYPRQPKQSRSCQESRLGSAAEGHANNDNHVDPPFRLVRAYLL
jgi:hypothetical protein